MSIESIIEILEKNSIVTHGCTLEEITKIEIFFRLKLPKAYTDFLLKIGKNAGKFMRGDSYSYDAIFDLKDGAIEIIEENNFISLPDDAFVFWMHQGYQFAFFVPCGEDDPKVFYYGEGENLTRYKVVDSITEFLFIMLEFSGIS